jgi:hypothetical protein
MLKQRFGNLFSQFKNEFSIGGRAGLDRLRPIGLDYYCLTAHNAENRCAQQVSKLRATKVVLRGG